jgi:hypothetical protein
MDYALILCRKYEGRQFSVGDTYDSIVSLDGGEIPSEAQLTKLWPTVQAEIEAEKQAREDSRLSAIAKLQALGLTVDEVQVAFGLKA